VRAKAGQRALASAAVNRKMFAWLWCIINPSSMIRWRAERIRAFTGALQSDQEFNDSIGEENEKRDYKYSI
jgi:hypothetical protein